MFSCSGSIQTNPAKFINSNPANARFIGTVRIFALPILPAHFINEYAAWFIRNDAVMANDDRQLNFLGAARMGFQIGNGHAIIRA